VDPTFKRPRILHASTLDPQQLVALHLLELARGPERAATADGLD
jgi:hypothetical protein